MNVHETKPRQKKKVVEQNPDIKFCYAETNCRLKIKWVDESIDDKFFSSMDELQEILGDH